MEELKTLQELQDTIHLWANQTFGNDRGASLVLNHLVRASKDLKDNPYDILKYSDLIILLLNAAKEAGYSVEDLIKGVEIKHQININREWEEDSDGFMKYIKPTEI